MLQRSLELEHVTAVAWMLGLGAFVATATPLWQPHQSATLILAIGVLAGLVMAATVAAVTGWGVLRLRVDDHPGSPGRRPEADGPIARCPG